MADYDLSNLGTEQANDEIWWQGFPVTLNSNADQWSGVADLQSMDLTS